MKANYNRAEWYKLDIQDYFKEYERRYPNGGPSSSSDCGGINGVNCGCWVCRSLAWGLDKKTSTECNTYINTRDDDGECSVFVTVVKVLLIIWLLVTVFSWVNKEYFANNSIYELGHDFSKDK